MGIGFVCLIGSILVSHYIFQLGRNSETEVHLIYNALYTALAKICFVGGLVSMALPYLSIKPNFMNLIANNRAIQLLASSSFAGYLYHLCIMQIRFLSVKTFPIFNVYMIVANSFGDLVWVILIAIVATLFVEFPIGRTWKRFGEIPLTFMLIFFIAKLEEKGEKKEVQEEEDIIESLAETNLQNVVKSETSDSDTAESDNAEKTPETVKI